MCPVLQASLRNELLKIFREYPIIPSLRQEEKMQALLSSRARVALVSSGSIFNIKTAIEKLHSRNKIALVHIDLIDGLGTDLAAIRYLKEIAKADGIVTPNRYIISAAKKEKLITIHRLFAHDTPSIDTGIKILEMSKPDFIEVLPGIMVGKVISILRKNFKQPVIGAGLVKTDKEVTEILNAGAVAVNTSAASLWDFKS